MEWQLILVPCSEATPPTPGAGVAEAKVDSLDMLLSVYSLTKSLPTIITLERLNLVVNCLDVHDEVCLNGELNTTGRTLEVLLLVMDHLEVLPHIFLQPKPSPTFFTLVKHTSIMYCLLVPGEITISFVSLVTTFN